MLLTTYIEFFERRKKIKIMNNKKFLLASLLATTILAGCGQKPTPEPTVEPTQQPTAEPTQQPTVEPTQQPTAEPTANQFN